MVPRRGLRLRPGGEFREFEHAGGGLRGCGRGHYADGGAVPG